MDCITVAYYILGDPHKEAEYTWINDIMEDVANENELTFEEDVKNLAIGPLPEFYNYIRENMDNKIQYSVVWCAESWDIT